MRTAITLGRLHGNKRTVELVSGTEVPIFDQLSKFKKVQVAGVHEKYEALELWTSDGGRHKHIKGLAVPKPAAEAKAKAK